MFGHSFTLFPRLVLTSLVIAIKFFQDKYYNNSDYAKLGGVSCSEMNSLEEEFLIMIAYDLVVDSFTYKLFKTKLENNF